MRILMLHNRYLIPGGEDQSTAAEAALLSENGHYVELLEQDNTLIERLGKSRTALRTVWSRDSFARVAEALVAGKFDILHVQNFFPLWSPSVYYAASRCRIPVVQTLRNYRLFCVNATFYRENKVCEDCLGRMVPWPGIVHGCYRGSRAGSAVVAAMIGTHRLLRTWERRVSLYIALTEFARDKFIEGGLPAEKIVVKPNFVSPSPVPGSGGGGYAIFIGRLSPEKGISTLLQAWTSAECPLPLKIVGDGPCEDLVRSAATAGSAVEYLGKRSSADVFELLRHAEVLVFPSEWYEGMPRTVIEAFALGTPVLASKIGATASMIVDRQTGLHFEPGNAVDLKRRVEWCSRNLAALRSMRNNTRAVFEAGYTGGSNIDLLLDVYRRAQESASRLHSLTT